MKNSLLRYHAFSMQFLPVVTIALFITILSTSCGNVKNLQYLQGTIDTVRLSNVQVPEPLIQKGDMLNITVFSDDPLATAAVTNPLFNTSSPSMGSAGEAGGGGGSVSVSNAASAGFLVNQAGDIQVYRLGSLPVEGKTKKQLADTLALLYSNLGLLKNPYIEVRFITYKITVIGEVARPGQFTAPSDKVNIFEAIGLAGDITVFGKRDNVLVVRETNGKRHFGRLNLKDPNVFLSPYFNLQQNDMVFVDVLKSKAIANDQVTTRTLAITTTLLSLAAILFTIFRN